jgi:4-hydroxybenzoate polyprenyltransferase
MNSPSHTIWARWRQRLALRPDQRVADATKRNWVDRFAPLPLRPYLRLARADRPAGTWLLLIPCWQSLALAVAATGWTAELLWLIPAFAIGAFLMRGAGCTWNDITDRDLDGHVARTRSRPIPSGAVSVKQALAFMLGQMALAFLILLTFNPFAIALGIAALVPVTIYPFMKRHTWWPQVFLGLAFNWGALLGWAAHTGGLGMPAVLLYLGGIAWTLHYDTIYAHQDREDDALIGVKSTARLFGARTKGWLVLFVGGTVALSGAAAGLALGDRPAALAVALAGVALYGLDLARQVHRLDIHDNDGCLHLFRANRDTGLILVLAFALAALV